jgi:HSP20 family protein
MIVRYWHPFQEVETLRRQLDRLLEDVSSAVEADPVSWTPSMRLAEGGDRYILTVFLAGLTPETIDIQVTRESIEVSGDRTKLEVAEGNQVLHDDVPYGRFRRVINLPEAIQQEAVTADFTHGVLTLTLPKVVESQNKVVKISLGQTATTSDSAVVAASAEESSATA